MSESKKPRSALYAVDLSSLNDVIEQLRKTDKYITGLLATEAIPRINDLILSRARGASPVHTGLLRNALAAKIVKYLGGQVVLGITGADSAVRQSAGMVTAHKDKYSKRGKGKRLIRRVGETREKIIKPAHYFHLVELGTKYMPARPFFADAVKSFEQQIFDLFRETFEKALAEAKQ